MKIASVGPHIVVPGRENDSKVDVTDYSGVTSVSDADVSGDSTNEAKKESQNFSRIFDLIQEAEKRKKKEKRSSKKHIAYAKYQLAAAMYSGPRLGTTYDTKA